MGGKKNALPTRFEEGQPNFWLKIRWPGDMRPLGEVEAPLCSVWNGKKEVG